MLNLSSYSGHYWLELFLRNESSRVVIWDLTTHPKWNEYRTHQIIWINWIFPRNSLELLSETFRKALEIKDKLELTLHGGKEIELLPLSVLQRLYNTIILRSPLLEELMNHPEGTPIDLTQLGIKRWWTHDENGWRQWFGNR